MCICTSACLPAGERDLIYNAANWKNDASLAIFFGKLRFELEP